MLAFARLVPVLLPDFVPVLRLEVLRAVLVFLAVLRLACEPPLAGLVRLPVARDLLAVDVLARELVLRLLLAAVFLAAVRGLWLLAALVLREEVALFAVELLLREVALLRELPLRVLALLLFVVPLLAVPLFAVPLLLELLRVELPLLAELLLVPLPLFAALPDRLRCEAAVDRLLDDEVERLFSELLLLDWFSFGFCATSAPSWRASFNAMAIACCGLVTLRPDRPLCSAPVLNSCITSATVSRPSCWLVLLVAMPSRQRFTEICDVE